MPSTAEEVDAMFQANGWEKMSGYNADVYTKPNANYVVKVFERDSAYLAFLDLITKHPNPHFPKLRGKMYLKQYDRLYNAVRLEKLTPIYSVQVDAYTVRLSGMLNSYLINKRHKLNDLQERNLELATEYLSDKPLLVEALDLIDGLLDRHSLDLNSDNIMARGDVPVIIDPVN